MRRAKAMTIVCGLAASLAPFSTRAVAQDFAKPGANVPMLVTADEVQYDQNQGLVVAKGHVELSQKDQILLADTVTYNQATDTVTASGNVSMIQPSGDVAFADFMELHDDFHDGFIKDIRVLFSDGSRMAGNTGRRVAGTRTELRRAVYSPCELCAADPTRPPVWQIEAEQAVDDKELLIMEYRDAVMEIDGFPVFYTPYISAPDPSVKRASGFLAPILGNDPSNGFRIGIPYYQVLAPDKDITFRPIFTTKGGTVLDTQYDERFSNGVLKTDGSVAIGSDTSNAQTPDLNATSKLRGHLFAKGVLDLTDSWRVGLDAQATSDQTYLERYHFTYTTNYLTDHVYAENFGAASYANISAYDFQNLNPAFNIAKEPVVLPDASYTMTTRPDMLGGRWQVTGDAMNLMNRNGLDERRLSASASWRLPFNGPLGDSYEFTAAMRGDGYDSSFTTAYGVPRNETLTAGRAFPQVSLNWRYPWIRPGDTVTALIEPIAAVIAAPIGGNPSAIPNEDAQSFEFDETDLFRPNRFPGFDRVDGGQRVDYGLHTGIYNPIAGSTQVLIGQSYRLQKDADFPIGAGLDHQLSDVVGRLVVSPVRYVDLFYRARLDGQNLAMRRQELGLSGGPANLRGSVSYIATSSIPTLPTVLPARQVSVGLNFNLTSNWSGALTDTQNLNSGTTSIGSSVQLSYRDDCLAVVGTISRSAVQLVDVKPGTSFVLSFVFKNLGDVTLAQGG